MRQSLTPTRRYRAKPSRFRRPRRRTAAAPATRPTGAHPARVPKSRLTAVRVYPTPGRGWHRQIAEIWELPLDGGEPRRLLADRLTQYDAPRYSADGKYLYFQVSYSTGEGLGMLVAGHRIQRLELATGQVENVRTTDPAKLSSEFVEALRQSFPEAVLATAIRERVSLREAWGHRQPITVYDPRGAAAEDYRHLTVEIEGRLR